MNTLLCVEKATPPATINVLLREETFYSF